MDFVRDKQGEPAPEETFTHFIMNGYIVWLLNLKTGSFWPILQNSAKLTYT